jgi:hypothetical protein
MHAKGVIRTLLAGTAAIVSAGTASAQTVPGPAGTGAGTTVTNTATASYSVNGVTQSATSNAVSFVVDRKVNLTVIANQQANTQVAIGKANVVTTFKVTNNTNGTQDFLLSANQLPIQNLFAGDNFDLTNLRVFVDSNGNGTYDDGVDKATYINELGADQSAIVFIVGDVPNDQAAALAAVTLIVQVAAGGDPAAQGAPLVPTVGLNDDAVVDVVFADNDSDGLGLDTALNGQGRASAAYEIGTRNVALSVAKSQVVISDPINRGRAILLGRHQCDGGHRRRQRQPDRYRAGQHDISARDADHRPPRNKPDLYAARQLHCERCGRADHWYDVHRFV